MANEEGTDGAAHSRHCVEAKSLNLDPSPCPLVLIQLNPPIAEDWQEVAGFGNAVEINACSQ